MKLFKKLALMYLLVFVIYYTLVSVLGMLLNHKDFFWITPAKLIMRILVPFFVVAQLYFSNKWEWLKK